MERRRIAILGGGPVGLEAALRWMGKAEVVLYESKELGAHVRSWEHVRLFSPWRMNRSVLGEDVLGSRGVKLEDEEAYPTGKEYLEGYLLPLSEAVREGARVEEQTRVLGVSRAELLKGDGVGAAREGEGPFLLHLSGPEGERYETADVVVDATGVLENPAHLGRGGLPALGESRLNGEVMRRIPDGLGADREDLAGRRILLVGHGHSALATLDELMRLRGEEETTEVIWAFRAEGEPRVEISEDPLPERARLDDLGNRAARGEVEGVRALPGSYVERLEKKDGAVQVVLRRGNGSEEVEADQVIANVGYRPDVGLFRELQVHLCYASDGPMKLAASLMSQAGGDCLATETGSAEVLRNPEPDFFVIGAKSFGRNSSFLLRLGLEQIEQVEELLGL